MAKSPSSPFLPSQWADAANSIASSPFPPPITLICGPKNSGKSTFSRYLLNTLLQSYERVVYLDTDVGQPEFTTPGCLSLNVIDTPVTDMMMGLGLRKPERCFFFGDISSKGDPQAYLNYIFNLYDYFHKEFYQSEVDSPEKLMLPLIINTPGWVKGTGFDILVEMLRYIYPTHVVQLRISVEYKNLPTGAFWLDEDNKAVTLIDIRPAQRDFLHRSVLVQKDARAMRDARLFDYFKQCFPSSLSIETNKELAHALASLPPYEVSFSRIKVMHLHCQVPRSEIFHSLNATIVGLAISSSGPAMTHHTPLCVGLGIVRGVDIRKDLLYVITPVPPSNLENVDLLLQGFIEMPDSLLQVRGCVSPYMTTNVLHRLPDKVW